MTLQPLIFPKTNTIKDRLITLLEVLIKQSSLNPLFLPTIKSLAINFLKNADEAELRRGIVEVREKFIPWILGPDSIEALNENSTQE